LFHRTERVVQPFTPNHHTQLLPRGNTPKCPSRWRRTNYYSPPADTTDSNDRQVMAQLLSICGAVKHYTRSKAINLFWNNNTMSVCRLSSLGLSGIHNVFFLRRISSSSAACLNTFFRIIWYMEWFSKIENIYIYIYKIKCVLIFSTILFAAFPIVTRILLDIINLY